MNKKTIIFYFSQSGNSLYVAKSIAAVVENTTLVSIPEAIRNNQYNYYNYEKVGFVIPLYFMGMPNMVKEFISKVEISKDSYAFSIVTRAITGGRILHDIDNLLIKKGVRINYGEYLTFPDSYIKWAEAPNEKKLNRIFQRVENSLNSTIEKINREDNNKKKEGFILRSISLLVYAIWKSRLKTVSKSFKVNNLCTGCGICEETCPSKNIGLENGKPKWSDKCEDCMACVQHCPKKAIYFNSKTINKKRYINPNIKLNELLYKND
jgi:NAD-dependent dihydropyrimidine dehydrogenase PreA subunit